jgi:hypothetical protein
MTGGSAMPNLNDNSKAARRIAGQTPGYAARRSITFTTRAVPVGDASP